MIAMTKFSGQPLMFNGSDDFRAKCVEVAAKEGLSLTFADPGMERERQKRALPDRNQPPLPKVTPEIQGKTSERGCSSPHREQPDSQTRHE